MERFSKTPVGIKAKCHKASNNKEFEFLKCGSAYRLPASIESNNECSIFCFSKIVLDKSGKQTVHAENRATKQLCMERIVRDFGLSFNGMRESGIMRARLLECISSSAAQTGARASVEFFFGDAATNHVR